MTPASLHLLGFAISYPQLARSRRQNHLGGALSLPVTPCGVPPQPATVSVTNEETALVKLRSIERPESPDRKARGRPVRVTPRTINNYP
jgi:hypothetical protein